MYTVVLLMATTASPLSLDCCHHGRHFRGGSPFMYPTPYSMCPQIYDPCPCPSPVTPPGGDGAVDPSGAGGQGATPTPTETPEQIAAAKEFEAFAKKNITDPKQLNDAITYYKSLPPAGRADYMKELQGQFGADVQETPEMAKKLKAFEDFVKMKIDDKAKQDMVINYYKSQKPAERDAYDKEIKDQLKDNNEDSDVETPAANYARIMIRMPAAARLTVDDTVSKSTSSVRTFVTPVLQTGRIYHYNLQATLVVDGQTVILNYALPVHSGGDLRVNLFPGATGVSVASPGVMPAPSSGDRR